MGKPSSDKDRQIIQYFKRTGNQAETAREFNLSRERVRQILNKYEVDKNQQSEAEKLLIKKIIDAAQSGNFTTIKEIAEHCETYANFVSSTLKDYKVEIKDNFIGQKFGLWTVIEKVPHSNPLIYRCLCVCKKYAPVRKRHLTDGVSQGCMTCRNKQRQRRRVGNSKGEIFLTTAEAAKVAGVTSNYLTRVIYRKKLFNDVSWFYLEDD